MDFLQYLSDQAINDFLAVVARDYKVLAAVVLALLDSAMAACPWIPYSGVIRSVIARFKAGKGLV